MLTKEMEQEIATTEGLAEIARIQLRAVLDDTDPDVIAALRTALMDGRVDGETYWRPVDHCGCPLGWIAFAEGADCPAMVACNRVHATTYALEEWALPIHVDDFPDHALPEDSGPFRAAVLVSWIDQFEAGRVVS